MRLECYEPPFNAEIDYIIGGMNELESNEYQHNKHQPDNNGWKCGKR